MRIPFCQLMIETEIQGILKIRGLSLTEALNSHAFLELECLLDEACYERAVSCAVKDSPVAVLCGEETLFFGRLYKARTQKERGKWELHLTFVSASYEMDVLRRSRVFYRQGDRYADVIEKVSALYGDVRVWDKATGGAACPGTLLQYEETDWEFLKRLASHFSTFLIPDTSSESSRVYFGLPDIDNGKELWDKDFSIIQDMDAFYRMGKGMKQAYTAWRIVSPLSLRMGENLTFNGTRCTVVGIRLFTRQGELLREYTLRRREGLIIRQSFNYEILGISLPVTVTNRKDNQIQVEFDVNKPYPSEEPTRFYTYGIESSSFYCMPEVGSRAHVYFPNRDDWEAIGVHALNPGDGAGRNPSNKRFSSPTGAAMELSPSAYCFQSDSGGATRMIMGTDGNVTITGTDIIFSAGTSISIGAGKENTPKISFSSKGNQLFQAGSSSMALEDNFMLVADKAKLKAESGDMSAQAQAVRDEVTAGDGALMDAYNSQGAGGPGGGNFGLPGPGGGGLGLPGLGGGSGSLPGSGNGAGPGSGASGQQPAAESPWKWSFGPEYKYKPKATDNKTPAGWLDKSKNAEDSYKTTLYDNDPNNKDKIDKYRHTMSIARVSGSGSVFDESKSKEASGRSGLFYGSAYATPGAWKAQANAYAGLTEENKMPGVGIQGSASFSLVEMGLAGGFGTEDLNIHAGADVAAMKAEAKADAVLGFNEKGQFQAGVAGEAGAYMLEGSVSGGVTVAGAEINAKATGRLGFGLEGQAGFVDGKLKVKLGACFIFGGSVEFEIDISKWFS